MYIIYDLLCYQRINKSDIVLRPKHSFDIHTTSFLFIHVQSLLTLSKIIYVLCEWIPNCAGNEAMNILSTSIIFKISNQVLI